VHALSFNRGGRLACAAVTCGVLMACQPTAPSAPASGASAANDQPTGAQKNDRSEQAHLFKLNPAPRRVFEVTFEIHDAPGPLMAVRGSAGYSAPQAPNCTFVTNAWAGTWGTPFYGMTLPLNQVGPNRFVLTVALDAMLDEDYYGKGVCRWEMGGAGATFAASASEEDTSYGLSLDAKELVDGATYREYFWKGGYPRRPGAEGTSSPGDRSPEGFGPAHRNNLFSITAEVKAKP